ncbi:MAG: Ig-like domain-containing protein [Defluviitaleaceae bacterium]|nr:Ig-like domain-containing protein [Defluviitaleaceae bacterium]
MKNFLSIFLIFILLNVFAMQISAQDRHSTTGPALGIDAFTFDTGAFVYNDYVSALEIDIFAALVSDGANVINPQTVEVLYDLSGNPAFLIADIVPHGFAIVFRRSAEISEIIISEGAVNPYIYARGRKIYAGPMAYIDFYGGVYTHLLTGRELSDGNVRHMQSATAIVLNDLPEPPLIRPFSVAGERRISNQRFIQNAGFGRNVSGTCGQIASSIMLVYYEKLERANGRPAGRVVPQHLFPPDRELCENLHDEMIARMGGGGTPTFTVRTGLNSYFNDVAHPERRALRMNATSFSTDAVNLAVNEIRADRPLIVGSNSRPPSDFGSNINFADHWMVAYGYRTLGGTVTHLIVHAGWHPGTARYVEAAVFEGWFTHGGCVVIIRPPITPLPPPDSQRNAGTRLELRRHVIPAQTAANNRWISTDTRVATVASSGRVSFAGPGVVTITHINLDDGGRTFFHFTVSQPMRSVRLDSLTAQQRRLRVNRNGTGGQTLQLRPTLNPLNTTALPLRWSSSDTRVATVNQNGLVTARGQGRAVITVTDSSENRSARVTVNVAYNPERIALSRSGTQVFDILLATNRSVRPRVDFTPDRAQGLCRDAQRNITWTSSNPNIVAVNARGTATARAPGSATITATTVNGITARYIVTSVVPVSSVRIAPLTSSQLEAMTVDSNGRGRSTQLFATVTPANATHRHITWTSSNPNVVSVNSDGVVTARGVGTARITATTPATGAQRARSTSISIRVRQQ